MDGKMDRETVTDQAICTIFEHSSDFIRRELCCADRNLVIYAIDGLVSGNAMSEYVIGPLAELKEPQLLEVLYRRALEGAIYNSVTLPCSSTEQAARFLVNGFCVLLFPGLGALACEVKTGDKRNPAPPEVENTIKGSKDAFVETVRSNTSLIRRHLRSPNLKIEETIVGRKSLTTVSVVWLQGVTNQELVSRMKKRLDSIQIDGLLSPAAVEEYVTGSRATAFPLLQYTERPDKFCQGILSGRIGLLVDGLPIGYLAPADLGYLMESPEDLGTDYVSASCIRVIRYVSLFLSLLLPGIYIALATFQQDLIPLPMLRAIIESKQRVPFSTASEVIALLLAFELLQESGIHLPRAVGQAVSVVGGIVVGTAAVEAGLVSPTSLITVSLAGICGFSLPNRDFAEALRLWRFVIAGLGAFAGMFGVTVGGLLLLEHLAGLTCLDVPYLEPFAEGQKPSVLRSRLKFNRLRPGRLRPEDRVNQK